MADNDLNKLTPFAVCDCGLSLWAHDTDYELCLMKTFFTRRDRLTYISETYYGGHYLPLIVDELESKLQLVKLEEKRLQLLAEKINGIPA